MTTGPVPEQEFSEPWHEWFVNVKDCLDPLVTASNGEDPNAGLPDQVTDLDTRLTAIEDEGTGLLVKKQYDASAVPGTVTISGQPASPPTGHAEVVGWSFNKTKDDSTLFITIQLMAINPAAVAPFAAATGFGSLLRDGTLISGPSIVYAPVPGAISFVIEDSPPLGNHAYSFRAYSFGAASLAYGDGSFAVTEEIRNS